MKYLLNTVILANPITLEFFQQRYHCRRCGACCSGKFFKEVLLHEGEGPRLAAFLKIDLKEFYAQYCHQVNYRTFLKFPCPFLEERLQGTGCRIHDNPLRSCGMFPLARVGNERLQTIGIDLRCPAGAELAEEFRKAAIERKEGFRKN